METKPTDRSLISLIRELRNETTTLVRQEIALAKAETTEKATRVGRNAAYIAAGLAVAYSGFIILLLAFRDLLASAFIRADLSADVAGSLSSFIVAVAIGLVGWALIAKGKKALAEEGLRPRKTIESLKEDKEFVKQKLAST
jgi:hypothetical protein